MKQEQILHEKQKTKKRHKNISREHFSFTNFYPKLRAKADTDSKLTKLLNDFCHTKKFAYSCANRITKTKNWWLQDFIFLQTLNSNLRQISEQGHKYTGATPYIDLKININTLNSILKGTGSQCNRYSIGVLWSNIGIEEQDGLYNSVHAEVFFNVNSWYFKNQTITVIYALYYHGLNKCLRSFGSKILSY